MATRQDGNVYADAFKAAMAEGKTTTEAGKIANQAVQNANKPSSGSNSGSGSGQNSSSGNGSGNSGSGQDKTAGMSLAELRELAGNAKSCTEAYQNAISQGYSGADAVAIANSFGRIEASIGNQYDTGVSADLQAAHLSYKADAYEGSVPAGTFVYNNNQVENVINGLKGGISGSFKDTTSD